MAHPTAQHSRYPQSHTNSRDDSVRLPSLKDLNFDYQRGHRHQETPSYSPPTESSVNTQDNSPRHPQPWVRSHPTQTTSPMPAHQQHHQLNPHQQHTPPLSAGHDSAPSKIEYTSKADNGGFMTPGIPLSAQTVPIPGSVNIGLGTRTDDSSQSQSKRSRRGSANTAASRDIRTPHNTYTPQYTSYPPTQPQPPPSHYHQISSTSSHPAHSPPSALDHIHPHATTVTQPTYGTYQQYMAPRMYPQHPPPPQPTSGNPYPSPGPPPAPPLQGPWEQAAAQHHPHPPPPQHSQHPQYTQHVSSHHPPPPPSQHLHMHTQQHPHHPSQPPPQSQPQALSPPPPPSHPHHPQQHPQQQQQQQQQQHQQQHQQQQQQQQHPHHSQPQVQSQVQQQQLPFARTTAIVPTNIDTRPSYPGGEQVPSARDNTMSEIFHHCQALYSFASHYAQLQPNVQPTQSELAEMSQRAIQVVRLLEEYRRANFPEVERIKMDNAADITPSDDHRPPKRPWEDMSQDGNADGAETAAPEQYPTPAEKPQSTAEQDMEIIRSKRATSTAGATGAAGQPKSKYRKRSRATPPGKCHSCNIRETPEWRRGPDGARTLCNACGLHYAKLMRKSNKLHGAGGDAPRIDMDTLRASARAADLSDKPRSKRSQQSDEPTSPMESAKPLPQQHHQGSFQVVPMLPQNLTPSTPHPEPSRVPAQHTIQAMSQSTSIPVPPPPWATTVPPPSAAARGYAPDQLQHQSFIRSSQHTTINTSPR